MPLSAAVSLLSGATVVIQLSGVDVDAQAPLHANMTNATLLSLPVSGLLYVWNGTAASPATPLNASSPLTLTASSWSRCPLCLLYVPTTPLSATNGSNYNDTLTFSVAVKNTSSINNATVTFTVTNPLTAQPITAPLLGDAPLYFSLQGSSSLHTAFSYLVLSLPQKGNLTLQSSQTVSVYAAGNGSGELKGSVDLWSTSQMEFTSAVSVYAGRYNSSLDPLNDTFTYSLIDSAGNHAAAATVTILYPPIHHAPSILTAFPSDLTINATSPSQDASTWTVIPYTIVDNDASPTSAFATAHPTCPFDYDVVVIVSPVTGAAVRLDPQRTVIVTVVSGLATGSAEVSFTCGLAACNAVLDGLQLQVNVANVYNLSISVTQVDTGIITQSTSTLTAMSDASSTSTGTTATSPSSSSSNNDSLSAPLRTNQQVVLGPHRMLCWRPHAALPRLEVASHAASTEGTQEGNHVGGGRAGQSSRQRQEGGGRRDRGAGREANTRHHCTVPGAELTTYADGGRSGIVCADAGHAVSAVAYGGFGDGDGDESAEWHGRWNVWYHANESKCVAAQYDCESAVCGFREGTG